MEGFAETHLGDGFPEYFLVGVFSYFPGIVGWLQNQFHLLHYSVLSLHFLQKLRAEINKVRNKNIFKDLPFL